MLSRDGKREVASSIYIFGKNCIAENVSEAEEKEIRKMYRIHHSALCKGYTPRGEVYVADYKGKFGRGAMLFTNYNTNYSSVTYLISR